MTKSTDTLEIGLTTSRAAALELSTLVLFAAIFVDAATGSAPQNINAVFLRLTNAEARIGPIVTTLNSTEDGSGKYSAIGGYLSQLGNWEIDLVVQRIGAYDLNHSFDAALGASSDHQNMDMSQEMNMHTEDHESSTTATTAATSANTNTTEGELESPSAPLHNEMKNKNNLA